MELDSSYRGTLLINNDFPLYSNMSFYYIIKESGISQLEIRIDSAIEEKLLDPTDNIVELILKINKKYIEFLYQKEFNFSYM